MNVANLELSKQLYELTKWKSGLWFTKRNPTAGWNLHDPELDKPRVRTIPKYNLGFLRKAILDNLSHGTYTEEEYTEIIESLADALIRGEDSTCEYAIKLFKEGKLKRDSHD